MAIDVRERVQDVTENTNSRNEEPRILDVSKHRESAKKNFEDIEAIKSFQKAWHIVTDDNYLTLFGFRRFRTAHLLNLRFLEEEIDKIDHQIFQAGLKLGNTPSAIDRLGLEHAKRDLNPQGAEDIISQELVTKLRDLLKQYGILDNPSSCRIGLTNRTMKTRV